MTWRKQLHPYTFFKAHGIIHLKSVHILLSLNFPEIKSKMGKEKKKIIRKVPRNPWSLWVSERPQVCKPGSQTTRKLRGKCGQGGGDLRQSSLGGKPWPARRLLVAVSVSRLLWRFPGGSASQHWVWVGFSEDPCKPAADRLSKE